MPPKSILSFTAQPSWEELAHTSVWAEWNSCELCVHQSALHEICRHQCSTSVRLIICPSSGVCIRGFLCHVMVSWLWEAFCSTILPCIHPFCQAWSPAVPMRTKWVGEIPSAGNLGHTGAIQLFGVQQSQYQWWGAAISLHLPIWRIRS